MRVGDSGCGLSTTVLGADSAPDDEPDDGSSVVVVQPDRSSVSIMATTGPRHLSLVDCVDGVVNGTGTDGMDGMGVRE